LLSGPVAVGKTSVTEVLTTLHGIKRLRTGAYLAELARQRGFAVNRTSLQSIGDDLDDATDYRWVLNDVAVPAFAGGHPMDRWLLDSVRKPQQVGHFRNVYGRSIVHVHLQADEGLLKERYERRRASGGDYSNDVPYEVAIRHPNEIASRHLHAIADAMVDVSALTAVEAANQVARHCELNGGLACARSS
jgi:hypothetical protein